ncbi:MAG: hypothetical protein KDE19_22000 [Caldilineaceae bacterium]|nr:hypothetical protein [Caldilineaceae bacterium]
MESALATLILMIALLFTILTFADTYFTTEDQLWQAQSMMEEQAALRETTALEFVESSVTGGTGTLVEFTFRNVGSSKLANFAQWDLIVQHYSAAGMYSVQWLPYVTGSVPGNNQWAVVGLYLSAAAGTPEVYEPGILNAGEEIVIQAKVQPPIGPNTTNLATLMTDTGYQQSALFVRP